MSVVFLVCFSFIAGAYFERVVCDFKHGRPQVRVNVFFLLVALAASAAFASEVAS